VLAYGRADADRIWSQYIKGVPENIRSTLLDPGADLYTLVLRVVAVASQQTEAIGGLSQGEVVAVLANSFAAHQNRLAGSGDAFEPGKIADVLEQLRILQFLEDDDTGLRLTPLGKVVAESGLAVASAVVVAGVFRQLRPEQLNRATLITAAQLTTELDGTRLIVNIKGVQQEIRTFVSELTRQGAARAVVDALGQRAGSNVVFATRAKKAVACLLWMTGLPAAQLERLVMQHYFDRNAIGPIRAVASRTHDVIGTVTAIAAMIHPTADLSRLEALLPVQLELGIPADLTPLAIAGADLPREHYLGLVEAGFGTPDLIGQAGDDVLLKCLGSDNRRLETLRAATREVLEEAAAPTLAEALPPPVD
jgi:helicase